MLLRSLPRSARSSLSRSWPAVKARLSHRTPAHFHPRLQSRAQPRHTLLPPQRAFATASAKSPADEIIEDITEQYATAKDEFEIAVEETQKNTVYAPDDRAAAGEEMGKLKEMYEGALNEQDPDVAAEVKRRVGSRIRELDEAIKGLEESAKLGD